MESEKTKKPKVEIFKNRLWGLFDDSSKLFILTMIMDSGITGNVKLVVKIRDNISYIDVENDCDKHLEIPVDILPVLND